MYMTTFDNKQNTSYMKSKSFLFALLTVIVFACDEPEVKDPVVGNWSHTITAPLQPGWNVPDPQYRDPINPALVTTFTITKNGSGYAVSNIKTLYGTNEVPTTAQLSVGKVGQSLTSLKFEGSDFFINMVDVRFNELNQTGFANGVSFKNPGNATVYNYPGSALSKVD